MTSLHEPADTLSARTRDMNRALRSLIEELDAVDWYTQRIEASDDAELRAVLAHNRDEEKEHAAMVLEWIRRRDPTFDTMLRRYLFRDGPIAEEADEEPQRRGGDGGDSSLGIGSLRAGAGS